MPEDALTVSLAPIAEHSDQYTLTYGTFSYPITFAPAKSVIFTKQLQDWQSLLTRHAQPLSQMTPLELMREIGTRLWQALLPAPAPAPLRDDLAQALRTGLSPLLFSLPQGLADLPWELLCDPEQSGAEGFVARQRPLVRLAPEQTQLATVQLPLRVLLLISSPPSLGEDSRVDVESERAAVQEAVRAAREAGLLHLQIEDIVTVHRVRDALVRFKPHILHFIGHGGYAEATGGVLLWEDEHGNALPIPDSQLATLLRPRHLAAVLLHACQTGRSNTHTEMRGVAKALIHAGIPAVVSQQANLSYASSQRASQAWYTALTAGETFATALFEVRQELSFADQPDWAVPILQMSHASLLPLLDAQAVPASPDPALTPEGAGADLPAPAGVFVGRHRELRALRQLLEPGSQQVMALVSGPGGIGKSTLVAQAIIRYGRNFKAALTLSCLGYQDISLFLQRIGEFLKQHGSAGLLENVLADPQLSIPAKIESAIAVFNQTGPFVLVVDNLETAQHDDQSLRDEYLLYFLQKLLTNLRRGRVLITGRYAVKDLLPNGKFDTSLLRLSLDDLSWYETDQLLLRHRSLAHLGEQVRKTLIEEFGGLPYVYDLLSSDAASQSLELLIRDVQGRITAERKKRSAEEWQDLRRQIVEFAALESTVARLAEPARTLLARISVFRQAFPLTALEHGLQATRSEWQTLLDWSLLRYEPLEKNYHLHSLTRRYAQDLLAAQDRQQTQLQLAQWYESYADQESHELTDYLEAHFFFHAAGDLNHAASLVSQLSTALRRFGLYSILRELYAHTLHDFKNVDQEREADSLHQLGVLAQLQGDYEQAQRLYQESLSIEEQLGNLSGIANSLGQLGILTQAQGESEEALIYTIKAYLLFESLQSPSKLIAQRMLAKLHSQMDVAIFMQHWHKLAGDHALPSLSLEEENNQRQRLMQTVVAFIQAPTWSESQQFLRVHPELLETEIDTLLQNLAALQEQQELRESIEQHRELLARCREQGIETAFAELGELGEEQSSENSFVDKLNNLCAEMITVLREGDTQKREVLLHRVEQLMQTPLPMAGAEDFLRVLAAWLRGSDDQAAIEKLQSPFSEAYQQMVAAVKHVAVQDDGQQNDGHEVESEQEKHG